MLFTIVYIASLWFLLSGYVSLLPLAPGIAAVALTNYLYIRSRRKSLLKSRFSLAVPRLIVYLLFLIKEIVVSNIQVAKLILSGKINPEVIRVENVFSSRSASVCYTSSIILTPGTMVVDESKDCFLLHVLDYDPAYEYINQQFVRKINRMDKNVQ